MAIQTRLPVTMADVFPDGAYVVGDVEPVEDFDLKKAGNADPQMRDKVTGKRVWNVRVVDADPNARKGQAEVSVKISADVQPVPPEVLPGLPFRPVEFVGLTVTPYVDTNRGENQRARQAFSFRATGMKAPTKQGGGSSKPTDRPAA